MNNRQQGSGLSARCTPLSSKPPFHINSTSVQYACANMEECSTTYLGVIPCVYKRSGRRAEHEKLEDPLHPNQTRFGEAAGVGGAQSCNPSANPSTACARASQHASHALDAAASPESSMQLHWPVANLQPSQPSHPCAPQPIMPMLA